MSYMQIINIAIAVIGTLCMIIGLIFSSMAASVAKRNDQLLRDTFRSIIYISPTDIQLILGFPTDNVTTRTIFTAKVNAIFKRKKTRDLVRPHFPPELVHKICLYSSCVIWCGVGFFICGGLLFLTN